MPIENGFLRNATGELTLKSRTGHIANQIGGVGVSSINEVYSDDAATSLASPALKRGWLFTTDGAICTTTSDPGNTRMRNGIKVSVKGEMFISASAPGAGSYRVYDPIFGSLWVSSNGAAHQNGLTAGILTESGAALLSESGAQILPG
jgi:hypothetical protein